MTLKIVLSIVLLGLTVSLNAQKLPDAELWTGATWKLRLNKEFRVEFEEQIRFNNNISTLKMTITEFGLRYRLNKYFSFKGNYRYSARPNKNNRTRVSLNAYYNWRKKKFPLSMQYRFRFQNTNEANSGQKFSDVRNKVTLAYNLSKLADPYLSFELKTELNGINEFRVKRLTYGLDWRMSKQIDLTTFYRNQSEINVKNPDKQNIIGIMLSYTLNVEKKKNKNKK